MYPWPDQSNTPCYAPDKFKFKFKDLYSSVYKYSTLDGYNKDIIYIIQTFLHEHVRSSKIKKIKKLILKYKKL